MAKWERAKISQSNRIYSDSDIHDVFIFTFDYNIFQQICLKLYRQINFYDNNETCKSIQKFDKYATENYSNVVTQSKVYRASCSHSISFMKW